MCPLVNISEQLGSDPNPIEDNGRRHLTDFKGLYIRHINYMSSLVDVNGSSHICICLPLKVRGLQSWPLVPVRLRKE